MRIPLRYTLAIALSTVGLTVPTAHAVDSVSPTANPANAANPDVSANPLTTGTIAERTAPQALALPDGAQAKVLSADKEILRSLQALTDDALQADGLDPLLAHFVRADHDRLMEKKDMDAAKWAELKNKFARTWKMKYGQDFKMSAKEREQVLPAAKLIEGQITNPGQLVGNWPVAPSNTTEVEMNRLQDRAQPALTKQSPTTNKSGTVTPGDVANSNTPALSVDTNLAKGRDIAVFRLPASDGLPQITASLILEDSSTWRFDIPDTVTTQQLSTNLMKHLQAMVDHPEQWPADVNLAYGQVARHVLMAVYSVDMPVLKPMPQ